MGDPEVVDHDATTHLGNPVQHTTRIVDAAKEQLLPHLEVELLRPDARPSEDLADPVGEGRIDQLPFGQVHADAGTMIRPVEMVPDRDLRHRLTHDDLAESGEQARLLGDLEEPVGSERAVDRVLPPHETLHADGGVARMRDDRLVVDLELAVGERGHERLLDLAAVEDLTALPVVEHLDAQPQPLRSVHRLIGIGQQVVGARRGSAANRRRYRRSAS